MRKSSETVAAIATALAKAQIELANPAKSMLGSVYPSNNHDSPRNFRYAPLSGGLEIIRKALGGQQIAVTQTTEIDAANGFTTVVPTNRITIFAAPPAGDHGLLFFDNWLRLVTTTFAALPCAA